MNSDQRCGYCRAQMGGFSGSGAKVANQTNPEAQTNQPTGPVPRCLQGENSVDSFEWNKVFAAVIASVLLIMVVGIISEMPFHHQEQEKPAFSIEVAQEASTEVVVDEGPSFVELLASADAGRGAREWNKCKACHTVDKGGANKTGPNLYGVIGRTVAALDDFNYSGALQAMGTSIWTYEMMDEWLTNPQGMAKGSKMVYVLRKPEQRANLIAYLSTFTDVQVPFPTPEAADEAVEAVAEAASGN